jgi:hypothetical protein
MSQEKFKFIQRQQQSICSCDHYKIYQQQWYNLISTNQSNDRFKNILSDRPIRFNNRNMVVRHGLLLRFASGLFIYL